MHHPTEGITHTTAFATPDVEHWLKTRKCSTTCVTNAVECAILFVGWCIKEPLLLTGKSSPCSGSSRFYLSLFEWSFTIYPTQIARGNPLPPQATLSE